MSYIGNIEAESLLPQWIEAELGPRHALRLLFRTGDIGAAEIHAALRWQRDWMEYAEGYSERSRGAGGGDIHTTQLVRAAAGKRLAEARRGIGLCYELRLREVLVQCLAWEKIGKLHHPQVSGPIAIGRAQGHFCCTLQHLAETYRHLDIRTK